MTCARNRGPTDFSRLIQCQQDKLKLDVVKNCDAVDSTEAILNTNDVEQASDLVQYFDFTVTKECNIYNNECDYQILSINQEKPVYSIGYTLSRSQFFPKINKMGFDTVKKRTSLNLFRENYK